MTAETATILTNDLEESTGKRVPNENVIAIATASDGAIIVDCSHLPAERVAEMLERARAQIHRTLMGPGKGITIGNMIP